MEGPVRKILILGGGSAGWLTAGIIAAEHGGTLEITLVESPDVPIIGVGEGTWPTMRGTLSRIGVSERAFLSECDASFKQGSKFTGWLTGDPSEYYYHPFSLPHGFLEVNTVPCWQDRADECSFAAAVSPQEQLAERGLAPKQAGTPDYAGVVNYAYHLDAVKFGRFLRRHCVDALGVCHVSDLVTAVNTRGDGAIRSVTTAASGELEADLFIDCSGQAAVLIEKHFGESMISRQSELFNDRALAAQVPYTSASDPIGSVTGATALRAGWVWDIGLPTRRGVGYVYSGSHTTDAAAEAELRGYLRRTMPAERADALELRQLSFNPGHRSAFWHHNCVAVGMAAGFIEPLEASALALVELSAAMIRDDMPAEHAHMPITAARFNQRFRYRWDRIVDFLKLHYVLSKRGDSDYWRDHRDPRGISERLRELLELWQYRAPSRQDFYQIDEIFPAASYQYVLYGMGFRTRFRESSQAGEAGRKARRKLEENRVQTRKMLQGLPTNRELLAQLPLG